MNARIEAAANAISESSGMRFDGFWTRMEGLEPEDREYALAEAKYALEASDAVMFNAAAAERVARAIHDSVCGCDADGMDCDDFGPDLAAATTAVIAALRDASHATGGANGAGVAPVDAGDITGAEGGAQP